jgi:hypothetical protein
MTAAFLRSMLPRMEQTGTPPGTGEPPKRYRVVVKGRLSERFAAGFEGITLEAEAGRSSLSGPFADQAQLFGLLDLLRDFGIELVSVNVVD